MTRDSKNLNEEIHRPYYEITTTEAVDEKLTRKNYCAIPGIKNGFWQIKLSEKSQNVKCVLFQRQWVATDSIDFYLSWTVHQKYFKEKRSTFCHIIGIVIYFDDGRRSCRRTWQKFTTGNWSRQRSNIKFDKTKVQYRKDVVAYVGYISSKKSITIVKDKIQGQKRLRSQIIKKNCKVY